MTDKNNLWDLYKQHVTPLKRRRSYHAPTPPVLKTPTHVEKELFLQRPILEHTVALSPLSKKIKRRIIPEARLDLHGLTLDQAYHTLVLFIQRCAQQRYAFVLVITGKGAIATPEKPTLRSALPQWLQHEALKPYVHTWAQARNEHGGLGAFYIGLKKKTDSDHARG